jgi:PAS domain S-box-containing protein
VNAEKEDIMNAKTICTDEILVVDDNPANLRLLEDILGGAGYRVRLADDGELALRSARLQPPSLVLLDIRMPGMDGYEVCRCLKDDDKTRSIPVIFLSILEDDREKVKAFQAGGVDYVNKPIHSVELLARVNAHLGLRHAQLELEARNAELEAARETLEERVRERSLELEQINCKLREQIEEHLQTHEALRESEERFRTLVSNIPGIVYRCASDEHWTMYYISNTIEEMTGYPASDFIGSRVRSYTSIIHPDDRAIVTEKVWEGVSKKQSFTIDYQIITSEGSVRSVYERGQGVYGSDGRLQYLDGVIFDITERKRSEEEIRRLKNYLANIIDSMPSILVGMDRDETVTQWNRQVEDMSGISATEAIGRPVTELLPDFSSWIKGMLCKIDQQRPASMEKLLIEKEGERRFYDLMCFPLTNGSEGAVLRIEDVTERARIQELMIQTEKLMSVGGLAAGMAHEINNPLGIIAQAVQNIERRVSPELPANRKTAEELGVNMEGIDAYFQKRLIPEFIGSIREASFRASRIIANMLQFSRRAETTIQYAPLDGIIEQALELAASDYDLKKKYDFRSIEIIRDYAPDMPEVPMVVVEMEQVMLNLLKNAAQAMIQLSSDKRPRITLRLRREERYARLEVEDNGSGMEEDVRRRVFEPFFTTKEPGIGTGLGLSVSYMIVTQNHKGLMEVESKPGKGACFRVRLPLSKESNRQ